MNPETDLKTASDAVANLSAAMLEFKAKQELRVDALETVMNRLAMLPAGTHAGGQKSAPFVMPSLREYKAREFDTKAQGIGNDPGGGYLVTTEVGAFFDRLRPATVLLAAGAQVLDMATDSLDLPGLAASTTVARTGEAGTITESDATFARVKLTARKYSVRTVVSSEWLADANPDARRIIADDHARQLAARLDVDMLEGQSGAGILGLRRMPGVNTVTLGSGNGLAPTLDNIADALARLEAANADMDRVALFMAPRAWTSLSKLKDLQDRYQIQPDPSAPARRSLFGRPVFTSSQIAINETVGGSSDCSYVVLADMSKIIIGRRLALGVLFDPFSRSSNDQVVIQTTSRWDMNVLMTAAVEIIAGVRP